MKKNTLRTAWWAAVLCYVAFVYATLNVAPALMERLDSFLGGKTALCFFAVYAAASAALLYYVIFIRREKAALKYLVLFLAIAGLFALVSYARAPAEKVHMAEYGVLGILLYNALKVDLDRFDTRLYAWALVLCALIGTVDEIIQYVLPGRYFDWRDIFMNAASGALVLLVIRINIIRKQ
jgi:VanZ family protein